MVKEMSNFYSRLLYMILFTTIFSTTNQYTMRLLIIALVAALYVFMIKNIMDSSWSDLAKALAIILVLILPVLGAGLLLLFVPPKQWRNNKKD